MNVEPAPVTSALAAENQTGRGDDGQRNGELGPEHLWVPSMTCGGALPSLNGHLSAARYRDVSVGLFIVRRRKKGPRAMRGGLIDVYRLMGRDRYGAL